MRLRSAVLSVVCLGGWAAACGGGGDREPPGGKTPAVEAPTLDRIELALEVSELPRGKGTFLAAFGVMSDGARPELTREVTWSSSDPAVARIEATEEGVWLAGGEEGTAIITATRGSVVARGEIQVVAAVLEALALTPPGGTVGYGGALVMRVDGEYSDGASRDVTREVEWSSSSPGVGIMSAADKGRFVSFSEGSTTITAALGGVRATVEITVSPPAVAFLEVSPNNIVIGLGDTQQMSARAVLTDESRRDYTSRVSWSSSDETILVVSAAGVITAVSGGQARITASLDGVSASVTARVVAATCPYPATPSRITYGDTFPGLYWFDAFREDGERFDFGVEEIFCTQSHSTVMFVLGAGWCPNCPDYMRRVDGMANDLVAAGALVVYVEVENNAGAPASNSVAQSYANGLGLTGPSVRVGDGDTRGLATAFGRVATQFPSAWVVRTRDMQVIASQERSQYVLPFLEIARNPERNY